MGFTYPKEWIFQVNWNIVLDGDEKAETKKKNVKSKLKEQVEKENYQNQSTFIRF